MEVVTEGGAPPDLNWGLGWGRGTCLPSPPVEGAYPSWTQQPLSLFRLCLRGRPSAQGILVCSIPPSEPRGEPALQAGARGGSALMGGAAPLGRVEISEPVSGKERRLGPQHREG